MKTPRQILLERHRDAEGKLNAIRRGVLKGLVHDGSPEARETTATLLTSLRRWVLSARWHLAGMGAAWMVVALLNSEDSPGSVTKMMVAPAKPPSGELLAALRENRRQVLELIEGAAEPTGLKQPVVPQRRGDIQVETAVV